MLFNAFTVTSLADIATLGGLVLTSQYYSLCLLAQHLLTLEHRLAKHSRIRIV